MALGLLEGGNTLIIFVDFLQNSFYKLMMGDNKSEKFFKVLHDRMINAQMDIKANVSVSVGEMTNKDLQTGERDTTLISDSQMQVSTVVVMK
jgi:inositol 1,4,5-triphosphate receptor type 3